MLKTSTFSKHFEKTMGFKKNYSKPMRINRIYDIVSLIAGSISAVLHILGEIIPGWWVLEEVDTQGRHVKYYFGVLSTRTCQSDMCSTEVAKMSDERAWLIGPAVLVLLAGVLLVSVIILITAAVIKSWGAPLRKLCVLLSAGAGGIILLAVLIFVKKKAGLRPSIAPDPDTADGVPGWTIITSSVGAVLALLNAIIIAAGVAKNFKTPHPPTSQLNMEIQVNGMPSADMASRRQIQKKNQIPRRGSGMVYYTERNGAL